MTLLYLFSLLCPQHSALLSYNLSNIHQINVEYSAVWRSTVKTPFANSIRPAFQLHNITIG